VRLSIAFTVDSVEFTPAVIAGETSLGGSESACLGLARALADRHDVHLFATQLAADAPGVDAAGVQWHAMAAIEHWAAEFDVLVCLRQPVFFPLVQAKYRVLWCQDLMADEAMKNYVMSLAWAYDSVAYVSEYHRHQWEGCIPELAPVGWVTKNGHNADLARAVRQRSVKKPNQVIHISRPERGLAPLLKIWPLIRAAKPDAELVLCRYSSMYDPQGWGEICRTFDEDAAAVHAHVGGISFLGELNKAQLYQAIAESAVMFYPGVVTFAETSCIAAIEAQACGTPFVGSYKGALSETVPSGTLIPGDAMTDPAYHEAAVTAVLEALDGCRRQTFTYRQQVQAGIAHSQAYRYETIARQWEAFLVGQLVARGTDAGARPDQTLSAGIITNDTTDLRRCLSAILPIVDEVVIGDCGADAEDLALIVAKSPEKIRVIPIGPVAEQPDGFAGARNRVLAATTGEWFLWIDSDEILCGAKDLRKYLDGPVFRGYCIPQNHLHLDAPMGTDKPVRLFRKGRDIQFYGCVHEQPQRGDCNGDIEPALQVADVQIAHTGYLHENVRREKALTRNLPLLIRDQERFPDRVLGKLLVLRDYSNLALWSREKSRGRLTAEVKKYQTQVIGLFEQYFMDPTHKLHALARPFYEAAIKDVAGALEIEVGIGGKPGGLGPNRIKADRVWVRLPEHARALLENRLQAMLTTLEGPPRMDVEPLPRSVTGRVEAVA
jgi:glycosyltransferase involved in cell wall biosynthesis